MARSFPPDLLAQAQHVREVWLQINSSLTFADATPAAVAIEIEKAREVDQAISRLESALVDKRNERADLYFSLWNKIKRVRAGVKAMYGDVSSQYEMIGGTRLSERKRFFRRPSAPETDS